jgi:hypothetical protein
MPTSTTSATTGSEIWAACDGGIFYSTDGGATFNRRMFGIAGTDFWGFGQGGWTGSGRDARWQPTTTAPC